MPFADIRPYTPADRAAALAVLGHPGVIDTPQNRLVVALAGPAAGVAVWSAPDAGGVAELGAVIVPPAAPPRRFYRLIAVCAEQALAAGFTRARFHVHNASLIALLQTTFVIVAQPEGRDPVTGTPVSWTVEVDLANARAQLAAVV